MHNKVLEATTQEMTQDPVTTVQMSHVSNWSLAWSQQDFSSLQSGFNLRLDNSLMGTSWLTLLSCEHTASQDTSEFKYISLFWQYLLYSRSKLVIVLSLQSGAAQVAVYTHDTQPYPTTALALKNGAKCFFVTRVDQGKAQFKNHCFTQ